MQKIEGIILITHPSRESDLVVKILTTSQGKMSLYARGARNSKRRFAGNLDYFEHVNVTYEHEKSFMHSLKEISVINSNAKIRENLGRLVCASLLTEIIEKIIPEDNLEPETIFYLLQTALSELQEVDEVRHSLKICYEKLYLILIFAGLIDKEPEEASAKKLFQLIELVENQIQAEIKSKNAVYEIIQKIKPIAS